MQELQCRFGNAPLWIFVNSWVEFMCRMFMNVWCAGVVSANLSMLLQLRLALYLCDRFAAAEATTVRDFAKSMFLWLVEGAVIAGWRAILNRAFHFAWNCILLGIIFCLELYWSYLDLYLDYGRLTIVFGLFGSTNFRHNEIQWSQPSFGSVRNSATSHDFDDVLHCSVAYAFCLRGPLLETVLPQLKLYWARHG